MIKSPLKEINFGSRPLTKYRLEVSRAKLGCLEASVESLFEEQSDMYFSVDDLPSETKSGKSAPVGKLFDKKHEINKPPPMIDNPLVFK